MTSMQFFPPQGQQNPTVPPEWGTGKMSAERQGSDLWTPKPASWWHSGKPVEQFYDLTKLKRSNIRWNDQLLPKPQEGDMTTLIINKPFPAEHPFSSHMSRHAVFPSFAENPEDPKRGVEARKKIPIDAECPANNYDVQIISKTKGSGIRRELQALPHQGQKKGLHWKGEDFSQLVKSHGGKKEYYPIPIKSVVPNLEHRQAGQSPITQTTSNALRNVERDQWQTTYDLSHTGLGPSNPKQLDNYAEKSYIKSSTGVDDDTLNPRSTRTFDPPRPHQGRIARVITPKVPEQDTFKRGENSTYRRKLTLTEREEDRLLNGYEHKNFPEAMRRPHDVQWDTLNTAAHPNDHLNTLAVTQDMFPADRVPFQNATPPTEDEKKHAHYLEEMKQKQHDTHQQIETENRWKVLESHKPTHDITFLQKKYEVLNHATDKPSTFYKHEGKFQAERAGLYNTSYNPYSLAQQMNTEQESAYRAMDSSMSHKDAIHLPTDLNWEMDEALLHSKTETLKPTYTFSDRPPAYDIIEPHQFDVEMQKRHLLPVASNAGIKTQERDLVLTQSTMGDSYNTPRFLQEKDISTYARNEPNELMSHKNKDLKKVRTMSRGKTVQFNDNVTVATLSEGVEPSKVGRSHISSPKRELFNEPASDPILPSRNRPMNSVRQEVPSGNKVEVNTTQYNSVHAQYVPDKDLGSITYEPSFSTMPGLTRSNTEPNLSTSAKFDTAQMRASTPTSSKYFGKHQTNYRSEFDNKSSSIVPTGMKTGSMMFKTSYYTQFPASTLDLSYKKDERFNWEPGCGMPRPQTSLIKIQDGFTKSNTHRRFHDQFQEKNPDLRENIVFGKKHSFGGMNAQVMRGTPIVN